ncbi:hypothetical protein [Curvibacter gracilis]|uniref:hypothetical protein n=1 Tax=Curvibacter gracilis TaxID=230310 RepID=UPI0012F76FAF|nr:hypothetical protein [Curvibacter gracilis]
MRKSIISSPLLQASISDILYIFLKEKYIANPNLLKIKDFTIEELLKNSFEMTGDDFFCLYEKTFRLQNTRVYANVKNYFHNGEFISNGIDFFGADKMCNALKKLKDKFENHFEINSVELLVDESFNYGSMIINGFLDVRFSKLRRPKRKKKFFLVGISTDYEVSSGELAKNGNTHGARLLKDYISFFNASKKFKNDPAIQELVTCVMKNFPHAVV